MTYTRNGIIQASDFNSFAGASRSPAASAAGAQNKAGSLWGVGFGDRGYGQVNPELPLVGSSEPVFKCMSDGNQAAGHGGFVFTRSSTTATQAYRMSQWVYINKSSTGTFYLGTGTSTGSVLTLANQAEVNPYWVYSRMNGAETYSNIGALEVKRQPVPGEWYLFVGIIQGSGYSGTGFGSGLSGIYDMAGNQIIKAADVKQPVGATSVIHRSFLYYSDDATQVAYIGRPRFEAITGSEPSIAQLINNTGVVSGQPQNTLINPAAWRYGDKSAQVTSNWSGSGLTWGMNAPDNQFDIVPSVIGGLPEVTTAVNQTWQNLRTVMSNLASWQNTATTLLPSVANVQTGAPAVAHEAGQTPSVPNMLSLLDTNRLNYQIGNMTLTASAASTTRGSAWGGGNSSIDCEFSVQFASEDAARYFFNTGGEVRIALAHPNTSTPQNSAWNTILANSNFAFRANSSARLSGAYGAAQAVGYYQLTTAYQTIINGQSIFTSPYSSNSFVVQARAVSIVGSNGAKGSQIYFRVILTDSFTSAFSDSVASGTVATLSHLRAGALLPTLPAAPTCTVIDGL